MSNLFKRVLAMPDATTCDSGKLPRPALQSLALSLSVILIAMMTMVKPAQASGTVAPIVTTSPLTYCLWSSLNPWARPDCGLSSADAACALVGLPAAPNGGCTGGYYYWTAGATTTSTCPANSIGTPTTDPNTCTCTDPYIPNPTWTNCILETYTISLTGLGGEVLSGATRQAYAEVNTSTGSAKSGATVTLTITVVEADDGHPAGQHTASHIATLTPTAGTTGADGRLNFTFTAPAAGGTHTITASCTKCSNQATGTIVVPVDQYTLTLNTPAGDIEPSGTATGDGNASKTMSVRMVNQRTGEPKSGAQVRITLNVQSGSGGHDHDDLRPKGGLTGCAPISNGVYDCITGGNGEAGFTFNATPVSGRHTISAACTNLICINDSNPNPATVDVKVAGLETITGSPFYAFIGQVTGRHTDNHYLTPQAEAVLKRMAVSYQFESRFRVGGVAPLPLHLNDASLVWGGRFDVGGSWGSPHDGHRRGVVIDVRANDKTGAIPLPIFENFKRMALRTDGAEAQVHCTVAPGRAPPTCVSTIDGSQDSNRHFHILLLGVDQ